MSSVNKIVKAVTKAVTVDKVRAATDIAYAKSFAKEPSFVIYDNRFTALAGPDAAIEHIETRQDQFAHEAGVYNVATDSIYFTASWQTNDPVDLFAVHCQTREIKKLNYPEVVQANGACQYNGGVLYCSQGDQKTPSSLVLVDPATGTSKTVLNNFMGRQFNSINDVVIHHQTGDIWFTDPTYGYYQGFRPAAQLPNQVYRFSPTTGEIQVVADGVLMCNGLCFSPDYKTMYVTDTGAVQAFDGVEDGHKLYYKPNMPGTIYAYDVVDGKTLDNKRVFAFTDSRVPDGIKSDVHGNIYSGCGDGIHVWDPKGVLLGKISLGKCVPNFCFAKGGLWVFAEQSLYFVKFGAEGALVSLEC